MSIWFKRTQCRAVLGACFCALLTFHISNPRRYSDCRQPCLARVWVGIDGCRLSSSMLPVTQQACEHAADKVGMMTCLLACRQLKAQEAAKKQASVQKQSGGADVQSKAPTTTQSKADDPKVRPCLSHTKPSNLWLSLHACMTAASAPGCRALTMLQV